MNPFLAALGGESVGDSGTLDLAGLEDLLGGEAAAAVEEAADEALDADEKKDGE